jgi:hypothetical protein
MGRASVCYRHRDACDTGTTACHQHCLRTCDQHSDLYVNWTAHCAGIADAAQQCKFECALQSFSSRLRNGRVDDVLRHRGDFRGKPAICRTARRVQHRWRIVWTQREPLSAPIEAISKVSFGVFVPIYFGIIGYRLVFGRQFSFAILLVFLVGSSLISVFASGWDHIQAYR